MSRTLGEIRYATRGFRLGSRPVRHSGPGMWRRGALGVLLALSFWFTLLGGSLGITPAAADPPAVLHVSATTDLAEGRQVTVSGSGFQPGLAAVAVGLCKQGYTNGLHDCDLQGGATFVNIAADGTFKTLTLTLHTRFHDIDCMQQQCIVAAAPLPGTEPPAVIAANTAVTPMVFAGSRLSTPPTPAAPAVVASTDTRGPSTVLWSVTVGLLVVVAGIAFADRRRHQ